MATRYTLATTAQTQTLTNKTIDADDNTISNIGYGECETQFRLGWTIPITGTLTRNSADDPTYVMKIAGVGIITVVAFSTDTTVTIYGGTDYDMEDTGSYAISACYASPHKAPFGFPLEKNKWAVELVNSSDYTQATATDETYYNLGSLSLSIPIGDWRIEAGGMFLARETENSAIMVLISALSTSNNSISSEKLMQKNYYQSESNVFEYIGQVINISGDINVTSKTTYYLIHSQSGARTNKRIDLWGSTMRVTVIRAVCTYL